MADHFIAHLLCGASASMTFSLVRPSLSTVSCRCSCAAAAELALSYFAYATAWATHKL